MIELKTPEEIETMAQGGAILASLLLELAGKVKPDAVAGEIDRWSEGYMRDRGGKPAFKGYRGYPATLCMSRNDVIVHGIPTDRMVFRNGDIVGIDVGIYFKGFYTDMCVTLPVGEVSDKARRLMDTTRESLYEGIAASCEGNRVSDVSHAVGTRIERDGFSAVRIFVGHGVGRSLHEDPQIPNYGEPARGAKLKAGMTFAIEPMVNAGSYDVVVDEDGWTARTADGKLSAHFEHSVAVTEQGPRLLTVTKEGIDPLKALQ